MKKEIKFLAGLFFLMTLTVQVSGQSNKKKDIDNSLLVEGVFVSNEQFLKQQPAFMPEQLYRTNTTTNFTIRSWSNKDSLYIVNNQRRRTIPRDSVWGFYDDGNLFLQQNGYFHKTSLIGSITLFNEIYPLVKAPFTPVATETTKEVFANMIDVRTNKIYPQGVKSLMHLLESDETLLNNYKALNKKLRKKMMYSYVERFNDRHPLF